MEPPSAGWTLEIWCLCGLAVSWQQLSRGSTISLHNERLNTVLQRLLESRAKSVIDLGCGRGLLLAKLLDERQFERVVGLDSSARELWLAENRLAKTLAEDQDRLALVHGSFTDFDSTLSGFDAAVMVEALEHVDPRDLSKVEGALFAGSRPHCVMLTTPNRDYNVLFGNAGNRLRHRDHRFEWSRAKFRRWAIGVARRNGYEVTFEGIGPRDRRFGCPTQMARFKLPIRA